MADMDKNINHLTSLVNKLMLDRAAYHAPLFNSQNIQANVDEYFGTGQKRKHQKMEVVIEPLIEEDRHERADYELQWEDADASPLGDDMYDAFAQEEGEDIPFGGQESAALYTEEVPMVCCDVNASTEPSVEETAADTLHTSNVLSNLMVLAEKPLPPPPPPSSLRRQGTWHEVHGIEAPSATSNTNTSDDLLDVLMNLEIPKTASQDISKILRSLDGSLQERFVDRLAEYVGQHLLHHKRSPSSSSVEAVAVMPTTSSSGEEMALPLAVPMILSPPPTTTTTAPMPFLPAGLESSMQMDHEGQLTIAKTAVYTIVMKLLEYQHIQHQLQHAAPTTATASAADAFAKSSYISSSTNTTHV